MRRQAISNSTGLDYWLVKKNRQKRRQGAGPMAGAKQAQPSLSSDMTMDYLPCRMGIPRLNRGRKAAGTAWAGSGKDGSGALPLPFIRKNGRNWQGNPHDTGKAGASCQRHLQYARGFLDSACEPTVHALRHEACPRLRAKALPPPRSQHRRQSRHPGHSLPPCSCCRTSPLP